MDLWISNYVISSLFQAKNKRDLLMWVREVIIPGLYHDKWYNNMTNKHRSFISDGVGYLIGSARLRLLRIKDGENIFLVTIDPGVQTGHPKRLWVSSHFRGHGQTIEISTPKSMSRFVYDQPNISRK